MRGQTLSSRIGEHETPVSAQEILQAVDLDGDGKVSFEEVVMDGAGDEVPHASLHPPAHPPYKPDAHLSPAPYKTDAHPSPAPYKPDAHLSPAPHKSGACLAPPPRRTLPFSPTEWRFCL